MSRVWESVKEVVVHRLTPPFLVKSFAGPYVAGDSIESALETARVLHSSRGVLGTMDILGEEVRTPGEVAKQVDLYLRLVERLEAPMGSTISLKPSAMGLELDENLPEAYTVLASIYTYVDWDWENAEKAYKRALELNPNFLESEDNRRYNIHEID